VIARCIIYAALNIDATGDKIWPRGSGQIDKWLFCLTPATLAGDQEIR
jgi:hypothetical protein